MSRGPGCGSVSWAVVGVLACAREGMRCAGLAGPGDRLFRDDACGVSASVEPDALVWLWLLLGRSEIPSVPSVEWLCRDLRRQSATAGSHVLRWKQDDRQGGFLGLAIVVVVVVVVARKL